jgi:hypothetical protein
MVVYMLSFYQVTTLSDPVVILLGVQFCEVVRQVTRSQRGCVAFLAVETITAESSRSTEVPRLVDPPVPVVSHEAVNIFDQFPDSGRAVYPYPVRVERHLRQTRR